MNEISYVKQNKPLNFCKFWRNFENNSWQIRFFAVLYILAVLLGALLVKYCAGNNDIVDKVILLTTHQTPATNFYTAFGMSFLSSFGYLFVLFFCGYCILGFPLIIILTLFKGLGVGFLLGAYYFTNGIGAIGFLSANIYPILMITSVIFLLGCKYSFRLSVEINSAIGNFPTVGKSDKLHTSAYMFIYVILTFFTALAAVLDAVLLMF